ncbi:UDP-glycosyltransferase 90A2 [Amborella trichopoda]|uniref:UDP-glycosyltransferase 90A2 n=1 Tax=Amborella trichopoda TaxID=13333 RepID=UPI0005D418C5|nr:UDP-glycosyltransferase 90A2 [Amborella trichopoda]|eukprot:XP_006845435.2 UDP-glycosyltransferase 90A2 [Amborella trichopoda]
MDMFYPFLRATQELCAHFEKALTEILAINPPMALISDAFLYWTLPIATKLGIPRISFMGVDACSTWLFRVIAARGAPLPQGPEILSLPSMPRGKTIKYADVPDGFRGQDPEDPDCVFILEVGTATPHSFGEIVNSFDELEPEFISVLDAGRPRSWCLGPMFLWNDPPPGESPVTKDASCLDWLNTMEKGSVLYVAFGTQARLGESQMREVGLALEGSGASFLWVVRRDRVR